MPTKVCRYIRTNGERCGSPALSSEIFCYYHVQLGKRHRGLNARPERSGHEQIETIIHPMTLQDGTQREPLTVEYLSVQSSAPLQLDFPPLEDRHSIQLALSMLITALAQDRIEPKRAAMLLYGLQVASANAKDLTPVLPPNRRTGKVRETVLDASGTLIAPDEDPEGEEEYQRPGSVARFLEKMENERAEKERKVAEVEAAKAEADAPAASPPPTVP